MLLQASNAIRVRIKVWVRVGLGPHLQARIDGSQLAECRELALGCLELRLQV